VNTVASGTAETALATDWNTKVNGPEPTGWTPAASTWVGLLKVDLAKGDKANIVPDDPAANASIVSTPLVLAIPKPMATALGWPKKDRGWAHTTKLARDPADWGRSGTPSGDRSSSARPTRTCPPAGWPRPWVRSSLRPGGPRT
jgi:Ca-activated chloride channel family protein